MTLERKELISEAKKGFMNDQNLDKLSDSAYVVELIKFYDSHK